MKKIIFFVIVILIALLALYFLRDKKSGAPLPQVDTNTSNKTFRPDPSNATFTFDGESITLSSGKSEVPVEPGSSFIEEVVLTDTKAYGDINADSKDDALVLLARYGGGSGTFIYLAGFVSGPVTYRGTNAVFIGDRVAPESISVSSGVIRVKYMDRGPEDSFADEPTIPVTKEFIYSQGELRER